MLALTFCQDSSLSSAVGSGERSKFEPFVLHVVCRTLEDAQVMVSPHDSTRTLESEVIISSLSLSQLFLSDTSGCGFRI